MESKHTKGEWKVDLTSKTCNYDCVTSEMAYQVRTDDWDIAAVWKDAEGDCEANAKLIAAAPILLNALDKLLTSHYILTDGIVPTDIERLAEHAIAEATS